MVAKNTRSGKCKEITNSFLFERHIVFSSAIYNDPIGLGKRKVKI
jgi:hypothetical protein